MKRIGFLIILLTLSACSNLPPAIKDAPSLDIAYDQVKANPEPYKNRLIRWGGVVIDVQNEQQYSLAQILAYPLNSYGRPQLDKPAEGRFLIKSTEFLDPAIYSKDTELTVAGILTGIGERKVGNKSVQMPQVSVQVLHRWPKYDPSYYYGYPGYVYPGYGYGYYGPYPRYRPFGYYPYYWGPYW
jgi:outer membrane lipoprotein